MLIKIYLGIKKTHQKKQYYHKDIIKQAEKDSNESAKSIRKCKYGIGIGFTALPKANHFFFKLYFQYIYIFI